MSYKKVLVFGGKTFEKVTVCEQLACVPSTKLTDYFNCGTVHNIRGKGFDFQILMKDYHFRRFANPKRYPKNDLMCVMYVYDCCDMRSFQLVKRKYMNAVKELLFKKRGTLPFQIVVGVISDEEREIQVKKEDVLKLVNEGGIFGDVSVRIDEKSMNEPENFKKLNGLLILCAKQRWKKVPNWKDEEDLKRNTLNGNGLSRMEVMEEIDVGSNERIFVKEEEKKGVGDGGFDREEEGDVGKYKNNRREIRNSIYGEVSFLKNPILGVDGLIVEESSSIYDWKVPSKFYEVYQAVVEGNIGSLWSLYRNGRDVNLGNADRNTPLHFAAANDNVLIVKELLKFEDITPNCTNTEGDTPLHIAIRRNNYEVVREMVKGGKCDMYSKYDKNQPTCVQLASELKNREINSVIEAQIQQNTKFLEAVKRFDIEEVKKLIEEKVVNVCSTLEVKKEEKGKDGKEKIVKLSCLDFFVDENRIDKHHQLVCMLLNRGTIVGKSHYLYESEMSDFIKRSYLRQKRFDFIKEILQSERVFVDDLNVTLELFAKPILSGSHTKLLENLRNENLKEEIIKFFGSLEKLKKLAQRNCQKLIQQFRNLCLCPDQMSEEDIKSQKGMKAFMEKETKIVEVLEKMDVSPFIECCCLYIKIERKLKFQKELWNFFMASELQIPLPRVRKGGFISILSKPRTRLIKYQGLLEPLMKYTDIKVDPEYYQLLEDAKRKMVSALFKIDKVAGEFENKTKLNEVELLLQKRYRLKLENVEGRKWIWHQTDCKVFNMTDMVGKDRDFFVLTDCLIIGRKNAGKVIMVFYKDHKSIWEWSMNSFRLFIYETKSRGGKLLYDYVVPFKHSFVCFKDMSEFFSKVNVDFYKNHILLISMFDENRMMEKFRRAKVKYEVESEEKDNEEINEKQEKKE